ncbi:tetratricopeptide repeat protein [Nostoc sp. NIES-2111]
MPPSNTDKFVGRERELERLHQELQRNHSVVIAAVEGMVGVGKTELAIQYSLLHLQLHNYPGGICWLRAREEDIGSQIIQFVITDLGLQPPEDLELQQRVRWCWQRWRQGDTLIVLDDVNDYSHIQPYLPPQTSQFKVLITTRLKLDLASSLFLSVLSETDSLLLLTQLIGEEKQNQELAQAKELCQRLDYLPLALQLVGSYIKKRNISLREMLQRLEEKGLAHPSLVVKENDPTWTLNVKHGVAAAFELSWSELTDDAQQLGCLLSLFALAPIPWSLVERAAAEQDKEKLEDTRVKLENLHLLQGEETYQLHQLIREFLRDKQKNLAIAFEQKSQLCKTLVKVAQEIPFSPTQYLISSVKDAIPHLVEVAQNLIDAVSDGNLIWVFIGLNRFYSGQGLYALAVPWCKQCVSVVQSRLGEEHPDVATSYNNLAVLYSNQGRYSEAEPLYKKALKLRQRVLGEEHPYIASSYNNLAGLYESQGRYSEAEPLYKKALKLCQRLLGEEHPYVASSYNNLAVLYYDQGRYSEAEPLYKKALKLRQRLLEEKHPDVASSYNNLAVLYYDQGRYSEAEPLYKKALKLRQRLLGEEHPDVASSYNNLAGLYESQGRYSEAEPLYKKALRIAELKLGVDHPTTATIRNNLKDLHDN